MKEESKINLHERNHDDRKSQILSHIQSLNHDDAQRLLLLMMQESRESASDNPSKTNSSSPSSKGLLPDYVGPNKDAKSLIKLHNAIAFPESFRQRCGCDQIGTCDSESHGLAYVDTDYNYEVSNTGAYDLVVRINHYGKEYYGAAPDPWDAFRNAPPAYKLFSTSPIGGPGAPGRGGYMSSGSNNTPGRHTGTLSVQVYQKGTSNELMMALWYFSGGWGGWGDQWLRCGHTYNFWFRDA